MHLQGWIGASKASSRPLRALVRCYQTAGGQKRYMAVIEDRSIEEERDLGQEDPDGNHAAATAPPLWVVVSCPKIS